MLKLLREVSIGHLVTLVALVVAVILFVVRTEAQGKQNGLTLKAVVEVQKTMSCEIRALQKYQTRMETIEEINRHDSQ